MLNLESPYWQDYRELMMQLGVGPSDNAQVPGPDQLNALFAAHIQQQTGRPIRFVAADQLGSVNYEEHIYRTGEVSTRQDNWHDLFNALVWARFPRIKTAMNASHYAEFQKASGPDRGPVRDTLTLFDECGAIVVSDRAEPLDALANRDWQKLFCTQRKLWHSHAHVFVLGHALLEKFLDPYKSITAQTLIVQVQTDFLQLARAEQREPLDSLLANQVNTGLHLCSSAELSPLPLMGIPGWWPTEAQDMDFYADASVFRSPRAGFRPATILTIL